MAGGVQGAPGRAAKGRERGRDGVNGKKGILQCRTVCRGLGDDVLQQRRRGVTESLVMVLRLHKTDGRRTRQ